MLRDIIIIGAGGHAKVCIELLQGMGETVAYCIGGFDSVKECHGSPVLQGDDNLARLHSEGYARAFVALGDNVLRDRLAVFVINEGFELVNAISTHAIISPSVKIGSGVAIMAGVVVNAMTTIGDLSIINTGATVDHDCNIGRAVHIAPQCAIAGNVSIGDCASLGIGTKVIPEVTIGDYAIIGAGGVVVKDIPKGRTAVGVPAKIIKLKCGGFIIGKNNGCPT